MLRHIIIMLPYALLQGCDYQGLGLPRSIANIVQNIAAGRMNREGCLESAGCFTRLPPKRPHDKFTGASLLFREEDIRADGRRASWRKGSNNRRVSARSVAHREGEKLKSDRAWDKRLILRRHLAPRQIQPWFCRLLRPGPRARKSRD